MFMEWDGLRNPVLRYDRWSIKDACMVFRDGWFHVFFSAFGEERSTVAGVKTRDFRTFSDFRFQFDGGDDGWIGMCSPDVAWAQGRYVLAFNSWGDDPARPNQLFTMESADLEHWGPRRPLAPALTEGHRAIDAALAFTGREWILFWKRWQKTMVAHAAALEGPWVPIGFGPAVFRMPDGRENGLTHENYQVLKVDGRWHVVCTDFSPHHAYVYTMKASGDRLEDWLEWGEGRRLAVPVEAFNTVDVDNAASLCDWREHDGYFYLLYAGKNEERREEFMGTASSKPWPRGWSGLALARSADLRTWHVPPG